MVIENTDKNSNKNSTINYNESLAVASTPKARLAWARPSP